MKLAMAMVAMLAVGAAHPPAAPALASIEMETTSWGRPIAHWTITADGTLTHVSAEPGPFDPKQMVTRRYAAGTAGFRQIRTLIGEGEARNGRSLPCTQAMYDAVYGKVSWNQASGRSKRIAFYTACRQTVTRRVVGQFARADMLARDWAAKGVVIEIKPGNQGGGQ